MNCLVNFLWDPEGVPLREKNILLTTRTLMNIMMKLQGVSGERNHIQLGRNVFLRTNADNNQGDIHAVS